VSAFILLFSGYSEIVSMLLRAANSQEQLKRVLDSFDIDGDTVYISLPLLETILYITTWSLGFRVQMCLFTIIGHSHNP